MELNQVVNKVYAPVFLAEPKPRYIILMGGRGAGRSTVASQFALAKLADSNYFRCAIMRYILGDIRNSIFREIVDRADENGVKEALDITDNTMTIRYGQNSINAVGFRKSSGDQKAKLKSLANYNCVIIEEADEIPEEDFLQLDDSLRTIKGDITIILLLNPPPSSHWINRRWFDLLPSEAKGFYIPKLKDSIKDTIFIHTNYKNNVKNLSAQIVTNYEAYKYSNPEHYWSMVQGLVPEIARGKIFSGWKEVEEVPHEARLEFYGLDFGFDPDPMALTAVYYYNGGYILDEIGYQTGLLNRHIASLIRNQPQKAMVVADSAEPKSIAELKEQGIDVIPAVKGADSVRFGIKKMQGFRISYTKRSVNLKREYENYCWKLDKEGNDVGMVDPNCDDHLIDSARYAFSILLPSDPLVERQQERERVYNQRELVESRQADSGL